RIEDPLDASTIFFGRERAERRSVCVHDVQTREPFRQVPLQDFQHFFPPTVQENLVTKPGGLLAKRQHEIGTIHTLLFEKAERAQRPDERYAICRTDVRAIENGAVAGVEYGSHYRMHGEKSNRPAV